MQILKCYATTLQLRGPFTAGPDDQKCMLSCSEREDRKRQKRQKEKISPTCPDMSPPGFLFCLFLFVLFFFLFESYCSSIFVLPLNLFYTFLHCSFCSTAFLFNVLRYNLIRCLLQAKFNTSRGMSMEDLKSFV